MEAVLNFFVIVFTRFLGFVLDFTYFALMICFFGCITILLDRISLCDC